tara:strand:+ start:139 stop:1023 length:885 start_codon:yes stop_codon:yes gene_type:complete
MPKIKKILVLMATYNGKEYIEEQIRTIIEQRDVDVEILISDDCSTDNTLEVINNLFDNNRISVLNNTNRFGSAASNFFNLIQKCNTESFDYIAFSDQDDIWFNDKLISAINKLKISSYDGFSSDVIAYWPKINKKKLIMKSFSQKKYDHWFEAPGPGCTQVLTIKSFEKFKDFIIKNKENLTSIDCHDWLVYSFYKHNELKWIISDEPKMLYRQHEKNVSGENITLGAKWLRFKLIMNNWYKNQVITNYELITKRSFNQFIKSEKLILKPFSLRRRKLHSLFLWFLIFIRVLKN